MENVIDFNEKKREKADKKSKPKLSTKEKIQKALRNWGSFGGEKNRKNDKDGTKKD